MATIAIIGGTGYTGGHLTTEARARGHRVLSASRNTPANPPADVEVRTGSIADDTFVDGLFADADVVVVAIQGTSYPVGAVAGLLGLAEKHSTRLGVVGGAGSLAVAPGGPLVIDLPQFPDEFKDEARAQAEVLAALRAAGSDADWFYVSPAAYYGPHLPDERTGTYRVGGDVLVTDSAGRSAIGGADFALAFLDEIDEPAHRRTRFTVGY